MVLLTENSIVASTCKRELGHSKKVPNVTLRPTPPAAQNFDGTDMATGRTMREKLEGGTEKRLAIALIVQLTQAQDGPSPPRLELTFTDNISAHGACVVSSRPWKRGELMDVTSVKDHVTRRGKVIHCQKRPDDRYDIGLRFAEHAVAWSMYRTYAGNL